MLEGAGPKPARTPAIGKPPNSLQEPASAKPLPTESSVNKTACGTRTRLHPDEKEKAGFEDFDGARCAKEIGGRRQVKVPFSSVKGQGYTVVKEPLPRALYISVLSLCLLAIVHQFLCRCPQICQAQARTLLRTLSTEMCVFVRNVCNVLRQFDNFFFEGSRLVGL